MSSDGVARPAPRLAAVRVAGLLLAAVSVMAWVLTMQAAARTLSFEPNSTQAINEAAAARAPALGWSVVLLAAAVARAFLAGPLRLAVLGAPGLVVAAFVLLAPKANGGALVWGLAASVLVGGVTVSLDVRHLLARRRLAPALRRL